MSSDETQDKSPGEASVFSQQQENKTAVSGCGVEVRASTEESAPVSSSSPTSQESLDRHRSQALNSCANLSEMCPSSSSQKKAVPAVLGGGHSLVKRRHRRQRRRASHKHHDTAARHSGDTRGSGRRRLSRSFRRAISTCERRIAMAPWNNNQFLLEDHGVETPSFLRSPASEPTARMDSSMSEEDVLSFDSGSEEGEFLERNFAQMYHQVHAESLSSLRHSDLVARCLELEEEVSALSRQATDLRAREQSCNIDSHSDLLAQLHELRTENDRLQSENALLPVSREENAEKRRESVSVSEE